MLEDATCVNHNTNSRIGLRWEITLSPLTFGSRQLVVNSKHGFVIKTIRKAGWSERFLLETSMVLSFTQKMTRNKVSGILVKNHGKKPQGFFKEVETNSCENTRQ